ncbi:MULTISPECIES: hypothetical protein [unclassified Ruegeria]|uniref:hypothetical protein n=1 Tax=unclassified Ruegeria TaxID=2625375 RepID=UPI0014881273|nr:MULTISPECIES: hypothetical protein [unclassified Ruegeria]
MNVNARTSSERIETLSRAANPALFEAAIDPQLLTVLMLANLMSPTLWQLRDKVLARAHAKYPNEDHLRQAHITLEMLAYVNQHFTHDYPMNTAQKVGVAELSDIRQRLGAAGVDDALDLIRQHFHHRDEQGLLTPALDIFPVLNQEKFPIFNYSTIDGLRAMRRLLGHKKHKPMGVTICADEATLTATLANILHGISFVDIFLLATPAHYTTFLRKDGERFWCNGKPEFFDKHTWDKTCAAPGSPGPQAAFAARLPFLDRLISPLGTLRIATGESSIPKPALDRFLDESRAFFGCTLDPLQQAVDAGITFQTPSIDASDLRALDQLTGADHARQVISDLAKAQPMSVFDQALYCIRDLDVPYPGAYLAAALHGTKLRGAAARVASWADACAVVDTIAGTEPVLGARDRLALPDEVLLFQTGDDVDKGLLLFSLLLASAAFDETDKASAQLRITEHATYCTFQGQTIDLRTLTPVVTPTGRDRLILTQASLNT